MFYNYNIMKYRYFAPINSKEEENWLSMVVGKMGGLCLIRLDIHNFNTCLQQNGMAVCHWGKSFLETSEFIKEVSEKEAKLIYKRLASDKSYRLFLGECDDSRDIKTVINYKYFVKPDKKPYLDGTLYFRSDGYKIIPFKKDSKDVSFNVSDFRPQMGIEVNKNEIKELFGVEVE